MRGTTEGERQQGSGSRTRKEVRETKIREDKEEQGERRGNGKQYNGR